MIQIRWVLDQIRVAKNVVKAQSKLNRPDPIQNSRQKKHKIYTLANVITRYPIQTEPQVMLGVGFEIHDFNPTKPDLTRFEISKLDPFKSIVYFRENTPSNFLQETHLSMVNKLSIYLC